MDSDNLNFGVNDQTVMKKSFPLIQHSIENSIEPIFWINSEGRFIYVNKAASRYYGYSREELLTMMVYDVETQFSKDSWDEDWEKAWTSHKREKLVMFEGYYRKKDGSVFPAETTLNYIEFEGEEYLFAFINDITERKKAEEALQKYAEEMRSSHEMKIMIENVINNSPVVIFFWRAEHNWPVKFVSENINQFGYSAEDFISGELLYGDIIHPSDILKVRNKYTGSLEAGLKNYIQEYRVLTKSGEVCWVEERTFVEYDEGNKVTSIQGIIVDITENKKSSKFLQIQCDLGNVLACNNNLQDTYKQVLELSLHISPFDSGCLYVFDKSTGALDLVAYKGLSPQYVENDSHYNANSVFVRLLMLGNPVYKTHPEISSMTAVKFPPDEKLRATALMPVKCGGKIIAVLKLISHSKNDIPEASRSSLETIASQVGIVIERATGEADFNKKSNDFQNLFDLLEDFLFILSPDGCIVHCNQAFVKRLAYSKEELPGMNILELCARSQMLEAARVFSDTAAGKRSFSDIPFLDKNGIAVPVETRSVKGEWNGCEAIICLSREILDRR